MIEIQLDENYTIADFGGYWQLTRYSGKIDKNGNAVYDIQIYPSTLASAIENYVRYKVSEQSKDADGNPLPPDRVSLETYVNRYEALQQRVLKALELRTKISP